MSEDVVDRGRLPEVKHPSPMNILTVSPEAVFQRYVNAMLHSIVSRDREEMVTLMLDDATRQYLYHKASPISIAAPPYSITTSLATAVETVATLYFERVVQYLLMVNRVVSDVLSGKAVQLGGMEVTLDTLPEFMKRVGMTLQIESNAFKEALERVVALYSMNLPPQYRSAVLNMVIEGIDVVSTEQAGVAQEELQRMLEALGAAETRRRRRRRT